MIILIDNGHGADTPGKCSPDGRLKEWKWTRAFARRLTEALRDNGMDARQLVTEEHDLPLRQRVNRVNALCRLHGPENVLLISIHNNAAGNDGAWHQARGFLPLVAPNASRNSRRLAALLYAEATAEGLRGNRAPLPLGYLTQELYLCRHTLCPAVLTENLFQDNRADLSFLLSRRGLATLIRIHLRAITAYLSAKKTMETRT